MSAAAANPTSQPARATRLTLMSCNVRCSPAPDGVNAWELRRQWCVQLMRTTKPDIIAAQEVHADQFEYLCAHLKPYAWHTMSDEPHVARPVNTIWYRRTRFALVGAGGYFLSATPHVCGSKAWDSSLPRLAVWVLLRDRRNGALLRVIATHLDHIGHTARVEQARMLCDDADAYPGHVPQLLLGDMNADAHHPAIHLLCARGWQDTYEAVHHTRTPGPTFHGFAGPRYVPQVPDDKIDWIFMRGPLRAVRAAILNNAFDGYYPSDHYFVTATVEYQC